MASICKEQAASDSEQWRQAQIFGPFDVQDVPTLSWSGREWVGDENIGAQDASGAFTGFSPNYQPGRFTTVGPDKLKFDIKKVLATNKIYLPIVIR